MGKFTFKKEERLFKEKQIQELFDKGSSFYFYPFRVFFLQNRDPQYPVHQVLISVSKKIFKRAVDRNLIKRRIREGYRLNKNRLAGQNKKLIGYIYSAKEILPSGQVHERLIKTFKRFEYEEKK